MSSVTAKAVDWTETGLVPDSVIRAGIRRLLDRKLKEIHATDVEKAAIIKNRFVQMMGESPIALVPHLANEQHYEVPAAFYSEVLGRNRKYSCCYWPTGVEDLDAAEDAALVLEAMSGFDPRDSTSVDAPVPAYSAQLDRPVKGLKIGVIREFFGEGLDPATGDAVRAALEVYRSLGAELVELSLPALPLSVPTYYVVAPAECSSNLSRFDGVRFGYRCESPTDLHDLYTRSRGEGFGAEVKRRIMTGTYVLSAGYYDAYYLKAQKVRNLINADFKRAFAEVDLLAGPTTPTPAFGIGAKVDDPITMYLNDIYTIGANLAGLPALSAPCGLVDGLPVGLQLIGPHFAEPRLLEAAHAYQRETDWHRRAPSAWA